MRKLDTLDIQFLADREGDFTADVLSAGRGVPKTLPGLRKRLKEAASIGFKLGYARARSGFDK